ncbi:MAG: class I SAM-dependent methyltransferase [Cyanobacteriota bacterium]
MPISSLRSNLSASLRPGHKRAIKHHLFSLLYGNDLNELAKKFGTDKTDHHFYMQHYQNHFSKWRRKKFNLLEIGIGGYEDPRGGGQSLRVWKAFFPHANIYALDIYDKSYHDESRIKTYMGSQVDETLLKRIVEEAGGFDIIIDDGSHINEHVITTFNLLFPRLNLDGIYVVEDLQTSYWETDAFGNDWGGSKDLQAPFTSMNLLKNLVDCLNYQEFMIDHYSPSYFDKHIKAISFYHNIAFIEKGKNEEGGDGLRRLRGW